MDPNNPVRPINDKSLTNVQRWVMSTLIVFTTTHLAAGVVVAAEMMSPTYQSPRIGLNVIAALFGVLGLAMGFMVHKRSPLTPWLWLGPLPGLVGLVLIIR